MAGREERTDSELWNELACDNKSDEEDDFYKNYDINNLDISKKYSIVDNEAAFKNAATNHE